MEIENLFRYPALAVELKPSARQGKARLRGLWRIMYSKTITQSHLLLLRSWRQPSTVPLSCHELFDFGTRRQGGDRSRSGTGQRTDSISECQRLTHDVAINARQ